MFVIDAAADRILFDDLQAHDGDRVSRLGDWEVTRCDDCSFGSGDGELQFR